MFPSVILHVRSRKTLASAANKGTTEMSSTKNLFVALFHSLFLYLPFQSCRTRVPDITAIGLTPDMVECFCPFRGLHYSYHQWQRYSVWAHSTQILKSYSGIIRIIVIIADKSGPEVWALVQVMAVYFGFRIFYQPDPLHGLGGILGQTVNTDPIYYSVAIGVVYVSKYTRAPYGSHKFLKAVQAAVIWWLSY